MGSGEAFPARSFTASRVQTARRPVPMHATDPMPMPMNSPEQPTHNRRILVFVSSTFRDMMGEGDRPKAEGRMKNAEVGAACRACFLGLLGERCVQHRGFTAA